MKDVSFKTKLKFFGVISSFLQKYGTGSNELEAELSALADKIGVTGCFLTTPTAISMTISDTDGTILSQITRVFPGEIDLFRLNKAKTIINRIHNDDLGIEEAIERIEMFEKSSMQYSTVLKFISFTLTSTALTYLFGGSPLDMGAAFVTGVIVALILFNLNSKRAESVKEALTALVATCFVFFLKKFFPALNVQIVVMTSLIILIPGLSLTIAIAELAGKHLVAGTARLMGAMVDFAKITAGIIGGYHIASRFHIPQGEVVLHNPQVGFELLAIIVCSLSVAVIFNADKKNIKWIVISSIITMTSLKFFHIFFVNNMAIFFSALIVGLMSNAFARRFNVTSATLLLPSIIFLVPGSIGMKGLHLLLNQQYILGMEEIIKTGSIAIMIVAGIFFSEVLMDPNKKRDVKERNIKLNI